MRTAFGSAGVAELADAPDSKSGGSLILEGSIPSSCTIRIQESHFPEKSSVSEKGALGGRFGRRMIFDRPNLISERISITEGPIALPLEYRFVLR